MKLKLNVSLLALTSSFLVLMNTPALSQGLLIGKGGHYGIPATITNLSATLTGESGFTGTGTIRYFYNTSNNNSNLQANIFLPVDGTTIKDSNTAVSNIYTLTINTSPATICSLVINDIDVNYNNATTPTTQTETAQYQTSVSEVGAAVTAFIGSCSTLGTLAASNTVSVSLSGASAPILTGTLAATVGHGFGHDFH